MWRVDVTTDEKPKRIAFDTEELKTMKQQGPSSDVGSRFLWIKRVCSDLISIPSSIQKEVTTSSESDLQQCRAAAAATKVEATAPANRWLSFALPVGFLGIRAWRSMTRHQRDAPTRAPPSQGLAELLHSGEDPVKWRLVPTLEEQSVEDHPGPAEETSLGAQEDARAADVALSCRPALAHVESLPVSSVPTSPEDEAELESRSGEDVGERSPQSPGCQACADSHASSQASTRQLEQEQDEEEGDSSEDEDEARDTFFPASSSPTTTHDSFLEDDLGDDAEAAAAAAEAAGWMHSLAEMTAAHAYTNPLFRDEDSLSSLKRCGSQVDLGPEPEGPKRRAHDAAPTQGAASGLQPDQRTPSLDRSSSEAEGIEGRESSEGARGGGAGEGASSPMPATAAAIFAAVMSGAYREEEEDSPARTAPTRTPSGSSHLGQASGAKAEEAGEALQDDVFKTPEMVPIFRTSGTSPNGWDKFLPDRAVPVHATPFNERVEKALCSHVA